MTNMTSNRTSNLTLKDDGLEVVEPIRPKTTSKQARPTTASRPSPPASEFSDFREPRDQADPIPKLLHYVSRIAQEELRSGFARAQTCPHLIELGKIAKGEATDMASANAQAQAEAEYV